MKQKIYPWLIVIAWAFIAAGSIELIMIGGSNFFKSVSDAIGSPVSQVALMMTCATMAITVASPIAGNLFARFDSRIVLTIMAVGLILSYAQLSFADAVWRWWLAGIGYGVFGAGLFIMGAPIFIGNWFKKNTGFALGLYGMLLAIFSAILNPCIAAAITTFGWSTAYLVLAIVSACMILPWTIFVVRYKPEQVGLKPYGYVEGEEETEKEAPEKTVGGIKYSTALKSVAFVCAVIAAGLMCNMGGFKSNWSTMAQSEAWGYVTTLGKDGALMLGATMISVTTAAKFFMPLYGIVADKIGGVKTNVATLILITVGFVLLWFFKSIVAVVYVGCFLVGLESANMKMITPLAIKEIFGEKDYSKIYSTIYGIANFLGAFATSLIAWSAETSGSYDGAMILGIVISIGSIIFLLLAKVTAKKLAWEE